VNLLAHLQLSKGCSAEALTGNVLADYLTRFRSYDTLPERLKDSLWPGIYLHREIDSFTDRHPLVAEARDLISPERRRLAGVIIDIAFDLYLTRHWETVCFNENREDTISRGYATLAMVAATGMSEKTQKLVATMRANDWFAAYGTPTGMAQTFDRMSRRIPRVASALRGAEQEVLRHDEAFSRIFLQFYPALQAHTKTDNADKEVLRRA